ncbi:MAG: aminotransferase class I/II-fold pyridoxal phosphate-dependent enzyme [Burkholderiaceae bacterium]
MLERRSWVPRACEDLVQSIAAQTAQADVSTLAQSVFDLVAQNRRIHDLHGINLNPASNVMNPRAEALMACGLGPRASLGYPGDKVEMGLEAIERIEVIAAEIACEVFDAKYAELRVGSGALANLYVFMATCRSGDTIIAPPAEIGGHVTHHEQSAAGWFGLKTVAAPVQADGYTIDVAALRALARQVRPKLITVGGSLNLFAHPVAALRDVADEVGAKLLFDAAHLSGMIAGRVWENPLTLGAHAMTMSTYKSLGGPPGGLILSNDAELAQRLDAIAYPGLTANFDVGKTAALAVGLVDWKRHGQAYAQTMQVTAKALAQALCREGLPVYAHERGATASHQFAIRSARWGGGQAASKRIAQAGLLACGIGLPIPPVAGDTNGLRLGVPEIVRLGMGPQHMGELASLIARSLLDEPARAAADVAALRLRFRSLHFID